MKRSLVIVLACYVAAGCAGPSELTDDERWWLNPPRTANRVAFQDKSSGKWGFKDRAGNVVISPKFDYAASFPGEGHILVQGRSKAVHVKTPSKPMGRVMISDQWGYIDAGGAILIPPRFDKALDFFEDLTAVQVNDKWGYIDITGRMIIQPQFDDASPFLLGVAHVRKGADWYTIDKNGNNTAGTPESR